MTARPNTLIPYFTAYLMHYFMTQKLGATAKNELQIRNQHRKINEDKINNFYLLCIITLYNIHMTIPKNTS